MSPWGDVVGGVVLFAVGGIFPAGPPPLALSVSVVARPPDVIGGQVTEENQRNMSNNTITIQYLTHCMLGYKSTDFKVAPACLQFYIEVLTYQCPI